MLESAAPVLDVTLPDTVDEAVAQADGLKSVITPGRLAEGIVWHRTSGETFAVLDGRECFKAISNNYLLKHGG